MPLNSFEPLDSDPELKTAERKLVDVMHRLTNTIVAAYKRQESTHRIVTILLGLEIGRMLGDITDYVLRHYW